jgi:hypothetical protein
VYGCSAGISNSAYVKAWLFSTSSSAAPLHVTLHLSVSATTQHVGASPSSFASARSSLAVAVFRRLAKLFEHGRDLPRPAHIRLHHRRRRTPPATLHFAKNLSSSSSLTLRRQRVPGASCITDSLLPSTMSAFSTQQSLPLAVLDLCVCYRHSSIGQQESRWLPC